MKISSLKLSIISIILPTFLLLEMNLSAQNIQDTTKEDSLREILIDSLLDGMISTYQSSGSLDTTFFQTNQRWRKVLLLQQMEANRRLDSLINAQPKPPMPPAFDFLTNIVAPLAVALITFLAGIALKARSDKARYKQKVQSAPEKYVGELDKLIRDALEEGEANALINARAIVAARNGFRNTLVAISSQLNSEIDRLAINIGEEIIKPQFASELRTAIDNSSGVEAYQTIKVLAKIWPGRKIKIEVEVRKLLTEMGLTEEL